MQGEQLMLQSMGRLIMILINCTWKCQYDMAVEGVKYTWGCTK
jgi:hypothetical protein